MGIGGWELIEWELEAHANYLAMKKVSSLLREAERGTNPEDFLRNKTRREQWLTSHIKDKRMSNNDSQNQIKKWWLEFTDSPIRLIGIIALLLAILFAKSGFDSFRDFLTNMSVELISIALTILIIDYLNEIRDDKNLRAQLIRELGSSDNGIVERAYRELKARNWTRDLKNARLQEANFRGLEIWNADLEGANLSGANFENAHLVDVNLENAYLYRANLVKASISGWLKGANLNGANLEGAKLTLTDLQDVSMESVNLKKAYINERALANLNMLTWSTMPNGERYDGRYNLAGDIELAKFNLEIAGYKENEIPNNAKAMADFYHVSLKKYKAGQEWAKKNLNKLKKRDED